ncbi:MAG: HAD family hydrolase [Rhodopila sp.]
MDPPLHLRPQRLRPLTARMLPTGHPLALVIFDCDGVLIDSEGLCDRVVSAELARQGWPLSPGDCHRLFLGLTFPDIQEAAEAHLRRALPANWVAQLVQQVTAVLADEVEPIPGARDALLAVAALGLPYRVASNSSRAEMAAKFTRTGFTGLLDGRIHSAFDVIARGKRGKPDPDLFLDAADAEGVAPGACLVIEDSLAGVRAAIASGMTCLGFSPDNDGAHLAAAGALPFAAMSALPDLLRRYLDQDE